jgi:hypothetical protein
MKIEIHPLVPEQDGRFYVHLFGALRRCRDARDISQPRPAPLMKEPRVHESAWVRIDGRDVFFDMSDHVFLFDLPALERCAVYFKANLNRDVARKVLDRAGLGSLAAKLQAFAFFAPNLATCRRMRRWLAPSVSLLPRRDVCHVVGVYVNPLMEGTPSVFETGRGLEQPGLYHFWVRRHVQEALQAEGLRGCYRLTSRGNRAIEDGRNVVANLSNRRFLWEMLRSRFVVVNTLPHAVFPWKVTESLALGRPIVIERPPLVEQPAPFELREGVHFLSLIPDDGGFEAEASLDDPRSYRVLRSIDLAALRDRARWLAAQARDPNVVQRMTAAVRRYAGEALAPETVARYVCDVVERAGTTG